MFSKSFHTTPSLLAFVFFSGRSGCNNLVVRIYCSIHSHCIGLRPGAPDAKWVKYLLKFVFISFSWILSRDEFFYVVKLFQILQNQYKFSMILFRVMEKWRFDMILLRLKWFCYIEKLIEWQFSQKAYKKKL